MGEEREALKKEIETDQARGAFGVQRVFVGSRDRSAQVQLHDTKGRVRARLYVDAKDVARLEFLDDSGKMIAEYPSAILQ